MTTDNHNNSLPEIGILFLGGAKRVTMAEYLADAFRACGFSPVFYSYELTPYEPIASVATIITGRRWDDIDIMEHLSGVCRDNGISVVIPFVDGAIEIAAQLAADNDGIYCPCSTPGLSAKLFDKVSAARLFEDNSLPIPATWSPATPVAFPLIAKPRRGSASRGLLVLRDDASLKVIPRFSEYIIQEYLENADEITVDCFITREGEITALSPRRRLVTLGGEVSRTVTLADAEVDAAVRHAVKALGLRGAVTLQYLRQDGRLLLMEINPRLGGGATASIAAGADVAMMIAREATGFKVEAMEARPGTLVARCFRDVVFNV